MSPTVTTTTRQEQTNSMYKCETLIRSLHAACSIYQLPVNACATAMAACGKLNVAIVLKVWPLGLDLIT